MRPRSRAWRGEALEERLELDRVRRLERHGLGPLAEAVLVQNDEV